MEKTLVLIKPDAFALHYSGDIIKRYEQEGFRIVGMKLLKMDERLASIHYAEHIGRPYYGDLVGFMTSAPLIALVLEGEMPLPASVNCMARPIRQRLLKGQSASSMRLMAVVMPYMHQTAPKAPNGKFTFSSTKRKFSMVSTR